MDSQKYLESYGWKKGEPLQKGGLKKPILVSHKFDLKGVGHQAKDTITWWETAFDGQLKSLDVNTKDGFAKDEVIAKEEMKKNSPLYQMFVKGSVLMGTMDANGNKLVETGEKKKKRKLESSIVEETGDQLVFFDSDSESDGERRKRRKAKKKDKKDKKEKKKEKKLKKQKKKERKEKQQK